MIADRISSYFDLSDRQNILIFVIYYSHHAQILYDVLGLYV